MKAIRPGSILPSMLVASSIPELEYPAWEAEGNYAVGQRVTYQRQWYESVQAPNTGNTPGATALYWAPLGASNRWRMFDAFGVTKSVAASPLVVTIAPGVRTNSLALRGLRGTSVKVECATGQGGLSCTRMSRG